jgi:hypothetical protein
MIRNVVVDLLRRSGRSLLASLALLDINFQNILVSLALLDLVLEYSLVVELGGRLRPTI